MRIGVGLVLSCLLVAPLVQASESAQDPRVAEARTACMAGETQKGIRLLAELYTASEDPIWIFNQARCYHQNAQPALALARFQEFLRKSKGGPGDEDVRDAQRYITEIETELQRPRLAPGVAATGAGPTVTPPIQQPTNWQPSARGGSVRSKNQNQEDKEAPPGDVDTPPAYRRGFLLMPYGGMVFLIDGAKHNRGSYTDEIFSSLGVRFGLLVGGHLSADYSLNGEFALSSWTYKIASDAGSGVQQFDFGATALRHFRWSWGVLIAGPKLGWSTLHNDRDFSWIGGPLAGARIGLLAAPARWVSVGLLADLAYLRVLDANNILGSVALAILF